MLVYANIAVTKVKSSSYKSTEYSFLCLEDNRGLSNKSIERHYTALPTKNCELLIKL